MLSLATKRLLNVHARVITFDLGLRPAQITRERASTDLDRRKY